MKKDSADTVTSYFIFSLIDHIVSINRVSFVMACHQAMKNILGRFVIRFKITGNDRATL